MSCVEKARAAWGSPPPWIVALAIACDGASQRTVASRIRINQGAISQAFAKKYPGDMRAMQAKVEKALSTELREAETGGWCGSPPDWVQALADACRRAPQAEVGRRIGYSPAVVSQVVSGTYKGNLRRVEMQVRGVLMGAEVVCPTIDGDPIALNVCVWNQELHFDKRRQMPGMSHRFRATCPTCPNWLKTKGEAQ